MKQALLIALIFGILFSLVSLIRHNNYFSQGQDLGIFTQSAWLYSKDFAPYNTITGTMDYQDRYKPIMLLLGLLFKFWADPKFLLIIQAIFLSFSGVFIYGISRHFGLGKIASYILMIAYLLFPGITSFIIDDFHEVSLFPFFLLGSIYFYLKKSKLLYVFLILSLIIRDYLVFLSLIFWLSMLFSRNKILLNKSLKKIVIVNLLGFSIMLVTVKLIGGLSYGTFNSEGNTLFQAIAKFTLNPISLLTSLLFPYVKLKTIIISFGYFAFLPLLNFWLFIPIFFQIAGRFLDFEHTYRWTIFYHYSGELAALLSFGAIITLKRFSNKIRQYSVILIFSLAVISLAFFHSPLLLLRKAEFWRKESWMRDDEYIVSLVPKDKSVAAQNNLVPHLSLRKIIYVLPAINDADYVAMDLRLGQDRFNFYSLTYEEMKQLQSGLKDNYELVSQRGEAYLYKKKNEK